MNITKAQNISVETDQTPSLEGNDSMDSTNIQGIESKTLFFSSVIKY